MAEKQLDKAIDAANAQIAKSPNNSAFYDLLGTILFNNKKDMNGAEAAFKKSAELDKNNSDALLKLGQVEVAKGSTDQAIETYKQSVKDNPTEPSFYILLGSCTNRRRTGNRPKTHTRRRLTSSPTILWRRTIWPTRCFRLAATWMSPYHWRRTPVVKCLTAQTQPTLWDGSYIKKEPTDQL